jgi:hypothetical protein
MDNKAKLVEENFGNKAKKGRWVTKNILGASQLGED